jgi:hypothetical protein
MEREREEGREGKREGGRREWEERRDVERWPERP